MLRKLLILCGLMGVAVASAQDPLTVDNADRINAVAQFDQAGYTHVGFDGQEAYATNAAGTWPANYAALSVNGEHVAYTDGDMIYANGVAIAEGNPYTLAISPNGALLAAAEAEVRIWDVQTGNLLMTLTGYQPSSLLFSPSSGLLLSSIPQENEIRLWDTRAFSTSQIILRGAEPLAFSPDGFLIAYAEESGSNLIQVRSLSGILAERGEAPLATLDTHRDTVSDIAFSADSALLATASADSTISLWTPASGAENFVLQGHTQAINAISLHNNLLASASNDGTVRLWDTDNGALLTTLEGHTSPVTDVALSGLGEQLASVSANEIIVWGVGGVDLAASITESTPTEATLGIIGTAQADLSGGRFLSNTQECIITEGESVLAIATQADAWLLYAGGMGCEGAVWVASDEIEWAGDVADLPTRTAIDPPPLARINDYDAVCQVASGSTVMPAQDNPYTAYPPDFLPEEAQATLASGVDILICNNVTTTPVENCHYLGPGNYSYIFTRLRTDNTISLVEYSTGEVVARRRFRGGEPPACPNRTARGQVAGNPPPREAWLPWVLGQLYGAQNPTIRTQVDLPNLNARALPNTNADILTTLDFETPVNLIGRTQAGDWVVALLPDMTRAWLFTDFLNIAIGTELAELPILADDMPAEEVLIQ